MFPPKSNIVNDRMDTRRFTSKFTFVYFCEVLGLGTFLRNCKYMFICILHEPLQTKNSDWLTIQAKEYLAVHALFF